MSVFDTCLKNRKIKKSEKWNKNIKLTRSSKWAREHGDSELMLHDVDLYTCVVCGIYSNSGMIDIAHIVAASDFDNDTPHGIINHIHNLLPMCRNCHRKFDSNRY